MYRRSKTLIPLGVLFLFSCATRPTQDYKETSTGRFTLIRYQYSSREITNACNESIARTTKRLDSIGHLKTHERTLENSLLAFEKIIADFGDETNLLTFMGYVSTDEQIRKEAAQCEEAIGQVLVSIFTRRDLYEVLRHVKTQTPEQGRLHSETLKFFEQNGLKLSEEKLAQVKNLKQRIAILETRFSANLNNDTSTIDLTEAELVGVPREFLGRFKKTAEGKFLVTTKSTDYEQIIENAINPETRKKMLFAYTNRQAQENTKILEEAILLRQQIAHLMGFNTWVDYKTWGRMAPDAKSVDHFLSGLVQKLKSRSQQDLAKLLHFKNELEKVQGHPPTPVEQWDTGYLAYQLRKRDYKLDDEKIREYFPSDVVMKGLFEVYSTLLGVQFVEVENANVWAPTVKLYKILDQKNQSLMAYFYTDMIPRPGKYGHAAAFTLVSGRQTSQGYSLPISAIVSNFNPPTENKPSLLNHDEVKTLFHEFGHIMHQTLTKAPYASLSGSNVAQDFVEAPSQMLENWVWSPEVLAKLSGHYTDPEKKLPPQLLNQIVAARDFNEGLSYMRQLMLALFDYKCHSSEGPVDVTRLYDSTFERLMGIKPIAGGHFAASFGHLMGGYDAGYYGYLWSQVYAQDMFSEFERVGILNSQEGLKYRKIILEKGNMIQPLKLVEEFLGRPSNNLAFYKKLKIQ